MTKSMLPRRLSIARIQHEDGTQQQTAAIDKLMAAGCAGARGVTDYQVFSPPSWQKWRVLQCAGDVCAAFDFTKLKVPYMFG